MLYWYGKSWSVCQWTVFVLFGTYSASTSKLFQSMSSHRNLVLLDRIDGMPKIAHTNLFQEYLAELRFFTTFKIWRNKRIEHPREYWFDSSFFHWKLVAARMCLFLLVFFVLVLWENSRTHSKREQQCKRQEFTQTTSHRESASPWSKVLNAHTHTHVSPG